MTADTTALDDARRTLHAALSALLDPMPWRVFEFPPSNVVTPCVWIDMPSVVPNGPYITASFPVWFGVDGASVPQWRLLYQLAARAYDAVTSNDGWRFSAAYPSQLDIGGVSSRFYRSDVTAVLAVDTLCHPQLAATA